MPSEFYGPMDRGRGQRGSLTQLEDGRWLARYRLSGRGGKRPQKIFPENRKREAASWLRNEIAKLEKRRNGDHSRADVTLPELCREYLDAHEASEATLKKLAKQLRYAERYFGEIPAASLEPQRAQAYRKTLPKASAHYIFRALNQTYRQAVRWGWLDANPCAEVPNRAPRRREVQIPRWEWIELVAEEIDERYQAVPGVLAGAGLRLGELFGLERAHVDLKARTIEVRQVVTASGELLELGADGSKSWRQRRNVPMRDVVLEALRRQPTRLDSRFLFAAPRGGFQKPKKFLVDYWTPAVTVAGVPPFPPKNLRHLYASEMLDSHAVDLFGLSRRMGTSVQMIDDTYGHLVHDADERELAILDAYDQVRKAAEG
jgi:integrase